MYIMLHHRPRFIDGHRYRFMIKSLGDKVVDGTYTGTINGQVLFDNAVMDDGTPLLPSPKNTPCTMYVELSEIICNIDITDG